MMIWKDGFIFAEIAVFSRILVENRKNITFSMEYSFLLVFPIVFGVCHYIPLFWKLSHIINHLFSLIVFSTYVFLVMIWVEMSKSSWWNWPQLTIIINRSTNEENTQGYREDRREQLQMGQIWAVLYIHPRSCHYWDEDNELGEYRKCCTILIISSSTLFRIYFFFYQLYPTRVQPFLQHYHFINLLQCPLAVAEVSYHSFYK